MRETKRHHHFRILGLAGIFLLAGVIMLFRSVANNLATEGFSAAINPGPLEGPKMPAVLDELARSMPQERTRLAEGESPAPPAEFSIEKLPLSGQMAVRSRRMRFNEQGEVQIYIFVSRLSDETRRELAAAGVTIELEDAKRGQIQARVPVSRLAMVCELPFVRFVRLPTYSIHRVGSVTTEGDAILKADQVRATYHVGGTGVKVGVISDGLKGVFATGCTTCSGANPGPIASGDLPSATGTRNASGVLTSSSGGINGQTFDAMFHDLEGQKSLPSPCGFPGAGAEGTALLEIVHDIAPGAQLSFANFGTDMEFPLAVNALAASNDIVVDDIGFFAKPFDGTSDVSTNTAKALNSTTNAIRGYFTSGGNEADGHYLGAYVDSGVDGTTIGGITTAGHLHQFAATPTTKDVLGSGPSVKDKILLESNGEAVIFLQWDDPFGASSNTYDVFLVQERTGNVVATDMNGAGASDPVKVIDFVNKDTTPNPEPFDIVIQNPGNRAAVKNLNMFVFTPECAFAGLVSVLPGSPGHEKQNFTTASNSVIAESDSGGTPVSVTSVGAICSGSPAAAAVLPACGADPQQMNIEFFSSIGPTLDGRTKPDVTAIDGVSVTGAGSFGSPFFGTSAAAPHAAGVAVLLLQTAPCLRIGAPGAVNMVTARTTLRNLILNNAAPIGSPIPNNTFGTGRIDALASASKTIPTVGAAPNQTVSGNTQTGASVPLTSMGFTDPNSCPLTLSWTGGCGTGSGASINCPFGNNSVSLMASNNGVTMSAPANVQITVTNFAVGVSPATATVRHGQMATLTVTLTPQFGAFTSAVTLGCTNLPAKASCVFSSPSLTPGANPATSTLTLSTAAASAFRWPGFLPRHFLPSGRQPFPTLLAELAAAIMAGIAAVRLKRRKHGLLLPAALVVCALVLLAACGGGSSNSGGGGGGGGGTGTPPGTYTINITGTAGSLSQSGPMTLTVQ